MCDNAMTYNRPDTVYYKLAKKILHAGFKMMSKVRSPRTARATEARVLHVFLPDRNSHSVNDTLPPICPWPWCGPLCSRVDAPGCLATSLSPRHAPPPDHDLAVRSPLGLVESSESVDLEPGCLSHWLAASLLGCIACVAASGNPAGTSRPSRVAPQVCPCARLHVSCV